MPPIQKAHKFRQPLAVQPSIAAKDRFAFPSDHHLIITTERHVLSYDHTGLHKIFNSGSSGILAAKEVRDGSGTLAIADSQVVVLHQVERGLEKSYRLKGADGQIRLLQFSPDSESLYFTTTLLNAVQSYSIRETRLLEPGPTHSSAPSVLALSPSSHILLTGSESPPTVYLQNLTSRAQPTFLQPHASHSPAVLAVFNPENQDLFLLAFKDGTIAFYDATQIIPAGSMAVCKSHVEGCEISFFKALHPVISRDTGLLPEDMATGTRSVAITGAAFLPGYRNRAVSVGADGRCNLLAIEKGKVLQSWHVGGSATALSVLSRDVEKESPKKSNTRLARAAKGLSKTLLAVGRQDGKISFFDASGTHLYNEIVDDSGRMVIDVEWIQGPGPKTVGEATALRFTNETCIELFEMGGTRGGRTGRVGRSLPPSECVDQNSLENGRPFVSEDGSSPTFYPEEKKEEFGPSTVKHRQVKIRSQDLPPFSANDYMDLFSPVKPSRTAPSPPKQSPKRRATPRPRPRLSSSTFVDQAIKSPDSSLEMTTGNESFMSGALQHPFLPAPVERLQNPLRPMVSSSPTKFKPPAWRLQQQDNSPTVSRLKIPGSFQTSHNTLDTVSPSASSANSKILADLRRFGETGTWSRDPPLLAPYMSRQVKMSSKRRRSKVAQAKPGGHQSSPQRRRSSLKREPFLPAGRNNGDQEPDDIWLTAESEADDRTPCKSTHSPQAQQSTGATIKPPRRSIWRPKHTRSEQQSTKPRNPEVIPTTRHRTLSKAPPRRQQSVQLQLASPHHAVVHRLGRANTMVYPSALIPQTGTPSTSPGPSVNAVRTSDAFDVADTNLGDLGSTERQRYGSPLGLPLPPGYAQSYQGPVDVGSYLPRRGSLAFVGSPTPGSRGVRTALRDTSGNRKNTSMSRSRRQSNRCHDHGSHECKGCGELKDEVQRLKEEVAELRLLMKRKI